MDYQNNLNTANRGLYPFTENNPYLPWYKKFKIALLGAGTLNSLQRLKDKTFAERMHENIKISKGKFTDIGVLTPITTPLPTTTPNTWTNVGVGVKHTWTTFPDALHDLNIQNKIKGLTPTPKAIPVSLPAEILDDINS